MCVCVCVFKKCVESVNDGNEDDAFGVVQTGCKKFIKMIGECGGDDDKGGFSFDDFSFFLSLFI